MTIKNNPLYVFQKTDPSYRRWAYSSAEEHTLDKRVVAGSNPARPIIEEAWPSG